MRRATILLADDHKATAEQLRALLEPEFDVVALVEDGQALVSAAAQLCPDVIVTDISMPGLDGIEATAQIRRSAPQARIVLVTVHSEPVMVQRGFAAGACGYVLKDTAGDELSAAVNAALTGNRYVSRVLGPEVERLMKRSWLPSILFTLLASVAVAQDKPNVVVMLADNVGYGDIGAYGAGEVRGMPTPHIDQRLPEVARAAAQSKNSPFDAVRSVDRAANT